MTDPQIGQKAVYSNGSQPGRVLWFGRRGTITAPVKLAPNAARKRLTNLYELLFTLLFFALLAPGSAVLEFVLTGLTAICIAALALAITLAALADWIFILLRRELRARKAVKDAAEEPV